MSGPRFVEVPAEAIECELDAIARACEPLGWRQEWTTRGAERVFELAGPTTGGPGLGVIRVYTSLSIGGAVVRSVGEDAVRVVVLARRSDDAAVTEHPVGPSQRLYRTAPTGLDEPKRVIAFLERLRAALRVAFAKAREVAPFRRAGSVHVEQPQSLFACDARLLCPPRQVKSGRWITRLGTPDGGLLVWFAPGKIEVEDGEILRDVRGRVLRHETSPGGLLETIVAIFPGAKS